MPSLLDFCAAPSGPSILPATATRRKSLAFPVGLLPFPAIAEDLARRGLAYLNGSGYLLDGARLDASEAARLAADVLEEASLLLPEPRTATFKAHGEKISAEAPLVRARAAETAPEGFERIAAELASTGSRALLAGLDVALAEPVDDDAPDFTGERFALKATAADLRTSSAAQRALLSGVRPHLPAPEADSSDAATAAAFLAALDARPTLRRSELAFLYSEAGSPGALPPAELRRLAEARWGAAIKSSGHFTYRPALASPPPADAVRLAPAPEETAPEADPLADARAALAALDAAQGLAPIYSATGARL